ncbi:MAG: septal ring lytic transglycosylase RlpA family protein [Alphaproteobacteria bacterium]
MTRKLNKQFVLGLGVLSVATLSLGTTATAGEYYVPSTYLSASAPITYKMTNPNMFTSNAPQAAAPALNQTMVDPNLYPHQRVGNPYTVAGQTYTPRHEPGYDMVGTASWYGDKFHGKMTANGETYDKNAMTAAHKTLPLNSYVIVTNMATGQSLKLRINDRGPFVGNRIIDLSEAAATLLGYKTSGLGDVRVQYAGPAENTTQQAYAAPVAPQYVAPAPVPAPQQFAQNMAQPQVFQQQVQPQVSQPQTYQPLRQQAPQAQQPQVHVPNIMVPAPFMPQAALPTTPHAIPEAYAPTPGQDDEFVTLTIKGPIHMATDRAQSPRSYLTPVVNQTAYGTAK